MSEQNLLQVEDLQSPPRVGDVYRVRCLELPLGLVPVMGPLHSDAEIIGEQASDDHYHHDPRFTTTEVARKIVLASALGGTDEVERFLAVAMPDEVLFSSLFLLIVVGSTTVERSLVCRRAMPAYDPNLACGWIDKLTARYVGQKAVCGRCPHQGLNVGSLPAEPDGSVVCRWHGLKLQKGCVVPRSRAESKEAAAFLALVEKLRAKRPA